MLRKSRTKVRQNPGLGARGCRVGSSGSAGLCPPGPGLGGAGEEGRRWHGAAVTPGSAGLKPSEHIPLVVSSASKLFCF